MSTEKDSAEVPELAQGEVEVLGHEGLRQRIRVGRHELTADEPESSGGSDAGPDPYGLLLAALGACTSMTVRMYADRKQWPLRSVRVRLHHAKVHADDCGTAGGRIDRIEKRVDLEGDLDADQIARLLDIADRCPVHRTLLSDIDIRRLD